MTTPDSDEALRASHKAMLEILVQLLEEVFYPLDKLMLEVESIVATAERLEMRRPPFGGLAPSRLSDQGGQP